MHHSHCRVFSVIVIHVDVNIYVDELHQTTHRISVESFNVTPIQTSFFLT